jgi:DNA-binding transcriptional LysR family regulator
MNLNLLRIYVAVVEARGFSRAAEALDISQPAASKAVKELESQLDTVLLERQGRSFQLSEPGRMLFDYGRSIFALEREADEVIRSFGALDRGQLTIGASTTIATYWLPPYLAKFHERYPGISLRLVSANTAHIAEQLLECGIDVALVEGPVADTRFETRPWCEDEMVVIVSREHPLPDDVIAPAALAEHLWVVRERGSGSREATDSILAGLGIVPPQTIEVGSNEAIVQTVAAGAGLGLVPRICACDQLALGRVRRILPQRGPLLRQLYRMRLPQRPVSHAALAFEALLLEPATGR